MATAAKDLADWDLKNLIAYVIDGGLPEAESLRGNRPGIRQAFLNYSPYLSRRAASLSGVPTSSHSPLINWPATRS